MLIRVTVTENHRHAIITIDRQDDGISLSVCGYFPLAQEALETIADLDDGDITSMVVTKTDGTKEVIR